MAYLPFLIFMFLQPFLMKHSLILSNTNLIFTTNVAVGIVFAIFFKIPA